MASSPIAAVSQPGRGRGGGIRLTSYSAKFDFSYLASQTISHSTAVYKSFFSQRKKVVGSRQKLNKFPSRSLQYKPFVQLKNSSHSLPPICEEPVESPIMPSPAPSVARTSQSDSTPGWTSVTNGAKQSDSVPMTQPVATNNSFDALSDDELDASPDSTEFGSTDVDTDMEADAPSKRKSKSSRKIKKSSKKSRRSRRKKNYVKFIDSDSDDEIPPRSSNHDKPSSTQKNAFATESESVVDLDSPNPSQQDDLVDSDKESTPLKNADIRTFMSQSSEPSQTNPTPVNPVTTPQSVSTPKCRKIVDRISVLNPTTTTSVIDDFTRYEMISILYQWNSVGEKNDDYMLNESIDSLRNHIYTLQKDMDDVSHEIRIATKHQEATQTRELKYQLQSQSATSPNVTPENSPDPILHYDSTNAGGLTSVPETSDAETLGMNVNMMMARPISHNPLRPPPITNESTPPAVALTQFSARFDIATKNISAINVPLITKQLFRIFKKADRTLRLLPWVPDTQNDISAIDQEDDIPIQENQIKQWVDNPRIVNSRLLFSLRVECIVNFKHIRDTFVPWMLKNDSHIKLDSLTAREIYGLGFIADVHPRLYNRAKMKDFLHQQLKNKNHNIELNVYSRRVWGTKNKQRIASHAIVIEVDKQYRDTAMSALMEIQFPPQYRYAKYIPFDKSIVPDDLLYDILLSNNEYQGTTRRKVISGLSDLYTQHPILSGSPITIREWLMSIKNPHSQDFVFEHVESSNDDIAVIYATTYDDTVREFLNHLTEHIRSTFSHPNDLLSTKKSLNTRTTTKSDSAKAYTKRLTSIFASNPQDSSSPPPKTPPKTKTIYYGAAESVQKTYLNHLMKPKQATPPAVTPPNSQASKKSSSSPSDTIPPDSTTAQSPSPVQQQIMNRLTQLEKANVDVNTKLDSKFQELEAKREADQTKLLTSVTEVVTTSLSNSLPQLIAAQLKVAFQNKEGEDQ